MRQQLECELVLLSSDTDPYSLFLHFKIQNELKMNLSFVPRSEKMDLKLEFDNCFHYVDISKPLPCKSIISAAIQ